MTIFAYYTPTVASPINDKRAGTIRVGSDAGSKIKIGKGWDITLRFAFRDFTNRKFFLTGRDVTARIYNTENVEIWNGSVSADATVDGLGNLVIPKSATTAFESGLYSLVIEYNDDHGKKQLAQSAQSLPRHILEVIDFTTVSLNN